MASDESAVVMVLVNHKIPNKKIIIKIRGTKKPIAAVWRIVILIPIKINKMNKRL
jgi:hypothetical protein